MATRTTRGARAQRRQLRALRKHVAARAARSASPQLHASRRRASRRARGAMRNLPRRRRSRASTQHEAQLVAALIATATLLATTSTGYCLPGRMADGTVVRAGSVAHNGYPLGTHLTITPSPTGRRRFVVR